MCEWSENLGSATVTHCWYTGEIVYQSVEMNLYVPFPSKRRNKKYSVYVLKDGRPTLISFGDSRYGQFRDKLGWYSHLDHGDEIRRALYYTRHLSSQ